MQLSTRNGYGTVSIETGTNRVVGNALSDWTQAIPGSSWFTLVGDEAVVYDIQSKTAPGASVSGFWEVLLDGVYSLPTIVGAEYAIHKDWTPRRHLPLFSPSDVQRSQILNRAMWVLDVGETGLVPQTALDFPTLLLPKPLLIPRIKTVEGTVMMEWLLLEQEAPDLSVGDVATVDDPTARLRSVG